jgi:hypothetical protein
MLFAIAIHAPLLIISLFLQSVPKKVFAFTYYGPKLNPELLKKMTAKTCRSCVGNNDLKYTLIHTSNQKRASWIEAVIRVWNEQQTSDDDKIRLNPAAIEDNIVTFSKKPGYSAKNHFIVKIIYEELHKRLAGDASTYEYWDLDL